MKQQQIRKSTKMKFLAMEITDTGARILSSLATHCPRCNVAVSAGEEHRCGDQATQISKFKPGDRVWINGPKHPWHGHVGTLVAFEPYGPALFGWKGWRVKLDCEYGECYAKEAEITKEKRRERL